MSDQSPFPESEQTPYPQATFAPPPSQPQPTNTTGIIGFILSLTGLIAPCMFPVGFFVSLFGLGKQPKGFAVAGLIIGAVGTLILLIILAFYGAVIAACVGVASTMQPVIETETAIQEAVAQIDDYYFENEELPDEATGNSLISGITDGWENELRYELDEDSIDGYIIRSAGADGTFDTADDSTSEDVYSSDWDDYEFDDSDWGEPAPDESGSDESSTETEIEDSGVMPIETDEPGEEVGLE